MTVRVFLIALSEVERPTRNLGSSSILWAWPLVLVRRQKLAEHQHSLLSAAWLWTPCDQCIYHVHMTNILVIPRLPPYHGLYLPTLSQNKHLPLDGFGTATKQGTKTLSNKLSNRRKKYKTVTSLDLMSLQSSKLWWNRSNVAGNFFYPKHQSLNSRTLFYFLYSNLLRNKGIHNQIVLYTFVHTHIFIECSQTCNTYSMKDRQSLALLSSTLPPYKNISGCLRFQRLHLPTSFLMVLLFSPQGWLIQNSILIHLCPGIRVRRKC